MRNYEIIFLKTLLPSVLSFGKESGKMRVLEDPRWVSNLAVPYHTLRKVRPVVTGFHTLLSRIPLYFMGKAFQQNSSQCVVKWSISWSQSPQGNEEKLQVACAILGRTLLWSDQNMQANFSKAWPTDIFLPMKTPSPLSNRTGIYDPPLGFGEIMLKGLTQERSIRLNLNATQVLIFLLDIHSPFI